MSKVAEQLRQAREAHRLTIEQVAEITKIRTDHLRALEEGDYNVFSAPVYIRGFVRSYSALLKLDVPEVMSALDAELSATQKFAEPPPLSNRPRGVVDFLMLQLSQVDLRKLAAILGVAVVVMGAAVSYRSWHRHRVADPLQGLQPAVYQPSNGASGETLPLPAGNSAGKKD
jgi:cytoskeleton protein RodZ